jgi:DNA-binding LacI/PurR family transcriptional regulator
VRSAKLSDVAKAAGVSQGTASNVFNRPELVRPEVRERVEACARRLNYAGPDPKGRLLRAGKVNAIGVVTNEALSAVLDDPGTLIMLRGIAEMCDQQGAGIALVPGYPNEGTSGWSIRSALVDGFIVFCLEEGDRLVREARQRKLPFVAIDLDPGPAASSIRVDDRGGARLAAEHLASLGHRHFGILSLELSGDNHFGPVESERRHTARYAVTRDRLAGYSDAFASAGIDSDSVPIIEVLHDRAAGATATAELLARHPQITAILAMSDLIALGTLDHARAAGISVPRDLSVVGFDDIPEAALADPPLTTVAQPIREKGLRAAALIFDTGPPRTELLGVKFVVRGSSGPARGSRSGGRVLAAVE